MFMNVLVIGSGGREHALCYSFRQDKRVERLYCANGNAGIAEIAACVDIRPDDIHALTEFAAANSIDLTFVGGEVSLAMGIVDEFESRGLRIIGPRREAAQLESSKAYAKEFMARHGIPTAKYVTAHSPGFAILELESGDFGDPSTPVVVKADGLAAGKGVVVAKDRAAAINAISEMESLVGSAAAQKIVLEECLVGKEISVLAFVDGEDFALMPPTRDHKRIGDGDTGPNTGGMGAITDVSLLTTDQIAEITETIVRPTLRGCTREGFSFRGILFVGIMLTATGPQVLEYNVRFGDPETQAILVRLETSLVDICEAMVAGRLKELEIKWREGSSACVVMASEGYPSRPRTGDVISGLDGTAAIKDVEIFHASSGRNKGGQLVTSGGRVLGVTATGKDLPSALSLAYAAVEKISWPGIQYRHDIGK
jgi:phosphoribosylamine--glycine ligase